ncbi:hypothetical protein amb2283 [Paramagnetospirillum magneticum AMB-1]|uniref:Uncharacterized protein n=2 Tax=Paramagnetospirillum magneticum TaxID=84159 RepID=Q2W4Y8_PARM1|nr:hypothetical protein amb2283 [Paramagnetospirillum magneticum AMB-1]
MPFVRPWSGWPKRGSIWPDHRPNPPSQSMPNPFDVVLEHLHASRFDDAENACRDILARAPNHPGALCLLGAVANGRGQWAQAHQWIDQAARLGGEFPVLLVERAVTFQGQGEVGKAIASLRAAVAKEPEVARGHQLLSELLLPGPDYYQVLSRLHEWLKPRCYLEIGVFRGQSMVLAQAPTIAVGIDPAAQLHATPQTVTKIFPLESDVYFGTRDVRSDLEADSVDLAFIDGLHHFEQTLRDFINVERLSRPDSVITIHDGLPLDSLTAARDRKTSFWTGDVWKIIPCLTKWRPDLNVFTVASAPSGLTVVLGADSSSRVLSDNFDAIVAEFMNSDPEPTKPGWAESMRMAPNDWDDLRRRLDRRAA